MEITELRRKVNQNSTELHNNLLVLIILNNITEDCINLYFLILLSLGKNVIM